MHAHHTHVDDAQTPGSKPRRRRHSKGMSKERKAEIMTQIENDRKALEEAKGMAEEQRKKAEEELKKKEEKIQAADEEQRLLAQRWAGSLQKFFFAVRNKYSHEKKR